MLLFEQWLVARPVNTGIASITHLMVPLHAISLPSYFVAIACAAFQLVATTQYLLHLGNDWLQNFDDLQALLQGETRLLLFLFVYD